MKRRNFIKSASSLALGTGTFLSKESLFGLLDGVSESNVSSAFEDESLSEKNGKKYCGWVVDAETERGIPNVAVTDGQNVVKTDENGAFTLPGYENCRFISATVPSDYELSSTWFFPVGKQKMSAAAAFNFAVKNSVEKNIDASNSENSNIENRKSANNNNENNANSDNNSNNISANNIDENFSLAESESKNSEPLKFRFRKREKLTDCFLHITDTETSESNRWIDDLKATAKNEKAGFIVHTGDICYVRGLNFHAENINTQTMDVPVRYCLGNHDLVTGKYGEELYESLFGPVWSSFDCGGVHYVVLPMLSGDYRPSFSKKDVLTWLKNDLQAKDEKTPLIIFNHDLWFSSPGTSWIATADDVQINLEAFGLKAWIYGHWHTHFYAEPTPNGVKTFCSSTPDKGGIDHGVSCFRLFQATASGEVSSQTRYTFLQNHLVVNACPDEQNGTAFSANIYDSSAPVLSAELIACNSLDGKIIADKSSSIDKSSSVDNSSAADKSSAVDDSSNGKMIQKSVWNWQGNRKESLFSNILDSQFVSDNKSPLAVSGDKSFSPFKIRVNFANGTSVEQPISATPNLRWAVNAGSISFFSDPVLDEDSVFLAVCDDDSNQKASLIAFNRETGKIRWQTPTKNSVKGAIALDSGMLLACDQLGFLYALDAKTGVICWEQRLHSWLLSPYQNGVAAENGIVYAGCGSGLSAWDVKTGKLIWKGGCTKGEETHASHTIADGVLVTGAFWVNREGFDLKTGKKLWTVPNSEASACNSPVGFSQGCFYFTQNSKIVRIDAQTGEILQKVETEHNLTSTSRPLITNNLLLIGTAATGAVAFDRETLKEVWNFKTQPALSYSVPYTQKGVMSVEPTLVQSGNRIFFGASDGFFYCLELATGKLIQRWNLGAPILCAAVLGTTVLPITEQIDHQSVEKTVDSVSDQSAEKNETVAIDIQNQTNLKNEKTDIYVADFGGTVYCFDI